MRQLVALRRWADWGKLENDKYIPVTRSDEMDTWKEVGEIPTAWLPARVRTRDQAHAEWDNYATQDDVIEFMKPFRDSIWHSNNPAYTIKSGFAMREWITGDVRAGDVDTSIISHVTMEKLIKVCGSSVWQRRTAWT